MLSGLFVFSGDGDDIVAAPHPVSVAEDAAIQLFDRAQTPNPAGEVEQTIGRLSLQRELAAEGRICGLYPRRRIRGDICVDAGKESS